MPAIIGTATNPLTTALQNKACMGSTEEKPIGRPSTLDQGLCFRVLFDLFYFPGALPEQEIRTDRRAQDRDDNGVSVSVESKCWHHQALGCSKPIDARDE